MGLRHRHGFLPVSLHSAFREIRTEFSFQFLLAFSPLKSDNCNSTMHSTHKLWMQLFVKHLYEHTGQRAHLG